MFQHSDLCSRLQNAHNVASAPVLRIVHRANRLDRAAAPSNIEEAFALMCGPERGFLEQTKPIGFAIIAQLSCLSPPALSC
ncbi:hypothetical protein FOCC_FOCC001620 [Frankliniella occidentalis]|nr:hypothetical protein FOCC_FOCC001620 [Frankliniella occidentalis]